MSFFGGSSKKEDKEPAYSIAKTGGFVDGLVWTLLQTLNDRKDSVSEAVAKSLKDIADQQPELVMSSCVNFMQTDTKASNGHRILVLKVMKSVVDENRTRISKPLAVAAINMAFAEMVESKDIKADWQNASSDVLVSLGIAHGPAVLDWVLKRMAPGEIPHYFVIKTLGDLAVADPINVVPNLKEVFGRLVALLNLIKHDNIRWVFSFAIGRFCEGIIFFLANAKPEQVAAANINKTTFSGEVFTAYQIMFDNWLQRNEASLRLVIMQGIGYMAETMARDQFEAQLPKMITGILAMYKKEKKFLPITQGLGLVLDVAVQDQSRILDPMLQVVLLTLHQLVCIGPDYAANDPTVTRNYSEMLRCFEILCKSFSDSVVSFLLARFESKEEKVRIGTLNIIKHIVNSTQSSLDDKKEMIISGLRPLLSETNLKVRKAFAQVVITLASRDYLGLEGGQLLVEFVVRQSSPTKDEEDKYNKQSKKEPDAVSPTALKTMCDNVLNLLTTTIPAMDKVLWPYLLELVVPLQYTDGLSIVCKSLGHIATKKRAAEDPTYLIDFDQLVNLPKPQAIISRLLVVLSRPNERPGLGENILTFFKSMGPVLHPSISELWDEVIPKLANYLKDKSNDPSLWVQSKWEDLIIKLLVKTIEEVNDDEWNIQFGEEMCKHFALYMGFPQHKSMLFKCLGVVLQKSQKKAFVRDKLDFIFNMVDHNVAEDRDGCAAGYGACSVSHLDIVLDKLQTVINVDMKKKSTGLFGLMSDKSDSDVDRIKCTVILCYGNAAIKADVSLIKARMEVTILNNILPFLATAKSSLVKECVIRSVELLGKTMHPSHLQLDYVCTKRKDLLQTMIKYVTTTVKSEVSNEVLTGSVNTAAILTQLEPLLPTDEEADLFSKVVGVIMRVPVAESTTSDAMIGGLEMIVQSLLEKKCNCTVLDRLLKYNTPYVVDTDHVKRLRALNIISIILQCFIDIAGSTEGEKEKIPDNVDLMRWVASIIPRCTDSQENIRALAVSTIGQLLVVKGMYATVSEALAQKMAVIGERIVVTDSNQQFGVVHDLSRSLAPELTNAELFPFVQVLLQGLSDKEVTSASGTCIVLNGILRQRGGELSAQVPEIVSGIHTALKGISNEQTLNGALHSLRTLTGHHLVLVADQFLQMSVPIDQQAVKALKTLAADAKIGPLLNKHYMDLLATSQPYIEKPKTKKEYTKEATKSTMAVTCALAVMFEVPEMEETVRAVFSHMLGTLLLRVGATNGIDKAHADGRDCNKDAVNALKAFLKCIKDEDVLEFINKDKNDENLGKADSAPIMMQLGSLLFDEYTEYMRDLVVFLAPYINTNFETQRLTVACLFAEFVRHCKDQSDLLALMINPIILRIADPLQPMKLLVLQGLGNVAEAGEAEVNRYSTTILSALMNGMEDATASPQMTSSAMDGLSKIMAVVDPNNVVAILVNICLKLRNYFETQNNDIRASAITLFGALSRFGDGPCKSMFYEQIQTNLVSLILHLNDADAGVKKATKKTLKQLGPLLQANEINDLLQTLSEDRSLLYGEFLHALCKRLVHYYGKQVNMYLMDGVNFFRSTWSETRGNAVMFIGFLLNHIPKEMRRSVNVDHVCTAMQQLIKDDNEDVRKRCAEAIALLYDY